MASVIQVRKLEKSFVAGESPDMAGFLVWAEQIENLAAIQAIGTAVPVTELPTTGLFNGMVVIVWFGATGGLSGMIGHIAWYASGSDGSEWTFMQPSTGLELNVSTLGKYRYDGTSWVLVSVSDYTVGSVV